MANIFKLTQGYAEKPKRNVYDLSFSNNITANFGTLYPVFCKEVNPGDSMKIDTSFGLRAQPMIFPIQTKMRADIHYFYVRNRTLWKDWMDFYGKTKENLIHPYIEQGPYEFKTSSIYDFLGVPTSVIGSDSFSNDYAINPFNYLNTRNLSTLSSSFNYVTLDSSLIRNPLRDAINKINRITYSKSSPIWIREIGNNIGLNLYGNNYVIDRYSTTYKIPAWLGPAIPIENVKIYSDLQTTYPSSFNFPEYIFPNFSGDFTPTLNSDMIKVYYFISKSSFDFSNLSEFNLLYTGVNDTLSFDTVNGTVVVAGTSPSTVTGWNVFCQARKEEGYDIVIPLFSVVYNSENPSSLYTGVKDSILNIGSVVTISNLVASKYIDTSTLSVLPWCGNNKKLKINALPYRAYEAIYNSFYRNVQNDPFKINGVNEYNKFVTNQEGGADTFKYQLYQRNWELDFLTSAVQSPQQGLAPLVGVTVNNVNSTATFKFQSEALNDGQPITATASVSDDGDVVGLQYYDPKLPQSNVDRLMQAINYGISINDIRQTNALQRWLEKNIRRGYRYRDQLLSHFGVSVSYNELLMPEFIGGVSQDVETQTIFQTVTNENGYLGDFAGRGSVVGQSRNSVSKYCDEAGFIIGIMSIVPIPVYSQVPAGYAFKSNLMDYYFPEFGKIGMQPIYNYHVTPLQGSSTELNNVFGYQRPWWDLISSVDEVHGEFRTSASGYLIHRQFEETPVLNGNFLKIDSRYINDVFAITDTEVSSQFLGVINFHVIKKTSIPLHGEPSIE